VGVLSPYRSELRALLRLAGPVAAARLGIMTMGLTDVLIVGRHSSVELGYMALSWGLTSVILTAAVGVLAGVQVLTARYIGQGRPEWTGGVFRRGAVYGGWLGLISALALVLAGPSLLQGFNLAEGMADGAAPSLRVFAWSLVPYLVATAALLYLEAIGKTGPGLAAMWIANAVNVALDLWLVPGGVGLGHPRGALRADGHPARLHPPNARGSKPWRIRPAARQQGGGGRAAAHRLWRWRVSIRRGVRLLGHERGHRLDRTAGGGRLGHRPQRLGHRLHGVPRPVDGRRRAGRPRLRGAGLEGGQACGLGRHDGGVRLWRRRRRGR
jgi:hypothetical protein